MKNNQVKTLLTGGIASTISTAADAMQDTINPIVDGLHIPAVVTQAEVAAQVDPHVFVQFFIAAITFIKYLFDLRQARKDRVK